MEGTLRLSILARVQIGAILNDRATGKGRDSDFITGVTLYQKIVVPDEEQEALKKMTLQEIRAVPDLEVQLNHNEMAKLEKVLTEFDKLRPMDPKLWYDDVMKQFAPPLEDKTIRDKRLADIRSAKR